MDCRTFQELISAAVDLQLAEGEMKAFKEHSRLCPPCRYEYEAEGATKSVVQSRALRVRTPDGLALRIAEKLGRDESSARPRWFMDFFRMPLVKPAIGFALAFVSILIFLKGPTSDSPISQASLVSKDVILQSLTNHRAVLEGHIKPQVSDEQALQESLFSGITDYNVHMPHMKDCTLLGGVQDEYAGTKLAHLVYQHDKDIVYMYQTCLATVMKGDKLCLSDEAKESLARTGRFSETEPDGRTVIVWIKGRTLCAAVAHMSEGELLACLTSGDERW